MARLRHRFERRANAAAEGIGHDSQIRESSWLPARRSMSATQNLSHASTWKSRSTKSGAGRASLSHTVVVGRRRRAT